MSDAHHQSGIVSLDIMHGIANGMSVADVLEALGQPFQRLPPDEVETPSETFANLGSSFQFGDDQRITEVWTYRHDRRGKFVLKNVVTSFLAFDGGTLRSQWRVNQMVE